LKTSITSNAITTILSKRSIKNMKHLLIGRSPLTTIAGYLVAILTAIYQARAAGLHNWLDLLLPAAIALFGRLAGDERKNCPPPSAPPALPKSVDLPPATIPADFLRRGRQHRQRRGRNGQFAPSVA
jgi:hypothetical protein